MQRENVWFSAYQKHENLDIVQKMQKNARNKDKKLEEFEKRLLDIDTGKAQEELRKKEAEQKQREEEMERRRKENKDDDIDYRAIRVSNIPQEMDEEELKEIFQKYGQVWRTKIGNTFIKF